MSLVLIAAAFAGGKDIPAANESFKTLKKLVAKAKEQGLIDERKTALPPKKPSKAKPKEIAVLSLTEQGQSALQRAASPETRALMAANQRSLLLQGLDADRAALRQEVLAAVKGKNKGPDPRKSLGDLSKTLTQLADRVAKLEASFASGSDDALLSRIDAAFADLRHKIEAATSSGAQAASPVAAGPMAAKQEPLIDGLRRAYKTLHQLHEFSDGLVPIPRLYHEVRRSLPALSVEALHRELLALWERRELELKVLNEVRLAAEPDKGIHRGENLYYFVYWPSS